MTGLSMFPQGSVFLFPFGYCCMHWYRAPIVRASAFFIPAPRFLYNHVPEEHMIIKETKPQPRRVLYRVSKAARP